MHQEGFLRALAKADWVRKVTLKYESPLPEHRRQSGWRDCDLEGVHMEQIQRGEVPVPDADHYHFFTGFKTHALIWNAFSLLPANARCQCFAYAEAPDLTGCAGVLRWLKYRIAAKSIAPKLDGMLALGTLGVTFYSKILPSHIKVHEFAYFDAAGAGPLLSPDISSKREHGAATMQLLCVGQLIRRKGLDRLLLALSEKNLLGFSWHLDVVGGGAEEAGLKAMAERLGIAERIHWHGVWPADELKDYYQAADYLILPSRWDGWGMSVNEALRHGCPAIASITCGVCSILPISQRLPARVQDWSIFFKDIFMAGRPGIEQRIESQKLGALLQGDAGVRRLREVLSYDPRGRANGNTL